MSMTTDQVVDEFHKRLKAQRTGGTPDRYKQDILPAENPQGSRKVPAWIPWLEDQGKSLWEVTTADLRVYLRDELLEKGYAPDTITVRRAAISTFYQELERMGQEDGFSLPKTPPENPAEDLDMSGWKALDAGTKKSQHSRDDIQYFTPQEVEKLFENAPAPSLRNSLIIKLMYQTGVRAGELTNIRIKDIDREERRINIREEKNNENRAVWYRESITSAMSMWLDVERNSVPTARESPYLFPTERGEQISTDTVNRIVKTAAEAAGLQEVVYKDSGGGQQFKYSAHSLRHSFAVQSLRNGMPVRMLQELLGHDKVETTEVYLSIIEEDVRDAARQYGAGVERLE